MDSILCFCVHMNVFYAMHGIDLVIKFDNERDLLVSCVDTEYEMSIQAIRSICNPSIYLGTDNKNPMLLFIEKKREIN